MTNQHEEFWLVWRDGSPYSRHRHWSKDSAVTEAKRLAESSRGDLFYVLKTTAAFVAPVVDMPPAEPVKLTKGDGIPF